MAYTSIALETLNKRYFERNKDGEVIEDAEGFNHRVAQCVAGVEKDSAVSYWYGIFNDMLSNLDFLPNTPTLMNAGKENGQLSACFVLPIEDSMDGIFTTLRNTAIIHQTGGGTGFDFSRLRPEGTMVSNKSGVSTGPLAFCQVYDKATEVIKQGASRRGANMMNLRVDHPDIEKFIDMKLTKGHMTNFNVSVTVTDEFMEALENDEEYELRHSHTGSVRRVSARYIWNKIADNAWRSAEPGIIFIDRVNRSSPYEERIEATNPCGEQPLPPYGSCNLGSINLANFVKAGQHIDWDGLGECVEHSVRFLDNVVDANHYPLPKITEHALKYRNIGLGVMGWADALIKMKIGYDTSHAVELGEEVQCFINATSHVYSVKLGQEKGVPSGAPFKKVFNYSSPWRRNATLTTVAPTGTISMIAGCSSGIEPNFAFTIERHQLETVLTEYHPLYHAAKNNGGVDKSVFVDAHQVSPNYHVLMQAAFQKHCDSGISKTINIPQSSTVEDVKQAYLKAWQTGCKGITVYRDGSREGVLHRKDEPKINSEDYCTECGTEMIPDSGCMKCPACGHSFCLIS